MFVVMRIFALSLIVVPAALQAADEGGSQLGGKLTVPAICSFSSAPRVVTANNMTMSSGNDATHLNISTMFEAATATLKPAAITLALRGVCNVPHQLSLSTAIGVMRAANQREAQTIFVDQVRYRATAQWGPQSLTLIADGSGPKRVDLVVGHAEAGDLQIEIKVDGSENDLTAPVIAGTYSDVITLNIAARH
jgi:hypothetical protein